MLPEVKKVKMPSLTLPTAWQTVIFRNYGYVKVERIAEVLSCDVDTVHLEAQRLCLGEEDYSEDFETKGYITIIRNNWFLLDYEQLTTLLGIDEQRLDFILENDDFLGVKLGNFKPWCKKVTYSPLSKTNLKRTETIAKEISNLVPDFVDRPFNFFEEDESYGRIVSPKEAERRMEEAKNGPKRIVHGYLSPCGDAFATDCSDTIHGALLERYRKCGVNGIWLHGLLSSLSYYPFMPSLSEGYEKRRENLRKIIERCRNYGISVYLYMNEPRALPYGVDPEYERLIGWEEKRTLCLSHSEVKDYLYGAVRDLCESVPGLGGIFTITMSENPTHCSYLTHTECPHCKSVPAEENAAEINNIFMRAMRDSGCGGEIIANLWGWSPYMNWTEDQIAHGICLLDKDISVMCVSEYDLDIEKGGIKNKVIDYSISNPGPSKITEAIVSLARDCGHRVYGKIQASNSWECAAVPYIPVYDLVAEHIKNLHEIGVDDLFLTWTQGGFPSPSIALTSELGESFNIVKWYNKKYRELAKDVRDGVDTLCRAFREYPFSVTALYLSPHTLGSANLWDLEPEEKGSTMVCFAYDDYESWVEPYGIDIYISQLEKLLDLWMDGENELVQLRSTPELQEMGRYASAAFCHFYADYLQTNFAYYKRLGDVEHMLESVTLEKGNALNLLWLMRGDARIGYEASNHYFYTERNLMEKIVRMGQFERKLRRRKNENG